MTMGEAGLSIFSHALGKQEREERIFWLEFVFGPLSMRHGTLA